MGKTILVALLIMLLSIAMFSFVFSQQENSIYRVSTKSEGYYNGLRSAVNVECLKNSQCSEAQECISAKCVEKNTIDLCQESKIAPISQRLRVGDSISAFRKTFTDARLPYLLSNGVIVESVKNNITEHYYMQFIMLGDNKFEKNNGQYSVRIDNQSTFLYKYKIYFSKDVDFSNKNILGQTIRILGKEYIIEENSNNTEIYFNSNERRIELQHENQAIVGSQIIEGTKVTFIKGSTDHVSGIEVDFAPLDNLYSTEKYVDPIFGSIEFSFNSVDATETADMTLGGKC